MYVYACLTIQRYIYNQSIKIYTIHNYTHTDRYICRERYIPVCEEPGLLELEGEAVLRGVAISYTDMYLGKQVHIYRDRDTDRCNVPTYPSARNQVCLSLSTRPSFAASHVTSSSSGNPIWRVH